MTSPRIEIDLSKIRHNTRSLVGRMASRGIKVAAVTKGVCGHPAVAQAMLDGGAKGLADARISNVQKMRGAGITCAITLIRTPMLSEAEAVVQYCDTSYNTEIDVIARLAKVAAHSNTVHNVILMVEMGDMREGIMPKDLAAIARQVVKMPGVALKGIGASFACLSGVAPDATAMTTFSTLTNELEDKCGSFAETVSGGNSANLPWALGSKSIGRINELRLGEAILLGVEPVAGDPIGGLYTDAFKLVAEVIESKVKPSAVTFVDPALGKLRLVAGSSDPSSRSILAIGQQDTDVLGLSMPTGIKYLGATSDHLVVQSKHSALRVGAELSFQMNYSALMHAMAAPDIAIKPLVHSSQPEPQLPKLNNPHLAFV